LIQNGNIINCDQSDFKNISNISNINNIENIENDDQTEPEYHLNLSTKAFNSNNMIDSDDDNMVLLPNSHYYDQLSPPQNEHQNEANYNYNNNNNNNNNKNETNNSKDERYEDSFPHHRITHFQSTQINTNISKNNNTNTQNNPKNDQKIEPNAKNHIYSHTDYIKNYNHRQHKKSIKLQQEKRFYKFQNSCIPQLFTSYWRYYYHGHIFSNSLRCTRNHIDIDIDDNNFDKKKNFALKIGDFFFKFIQILITIFSTCHFIFALFLYYLFSFLSFLPSYIFKSLHQHLEQYYTLQYNYSDNNRLHNFSHLSHESNQSNFESTRSNSSTNSNFLTSSPSHVYMPTNQPLSTPHQIQSDHLLNSPSLLPSEYHIIPMVINQELFIENNPQNDQENVNFIFHVKNQNNILSNVSINGAYDTDIEQDNENDIDQTNPLTCNHNEENNYDDNEENNSTQLNNSKFSYNLQTSSQNPTTSSSNSSNSSNSSFWSYFLPSNPLQSSNLNAKILSHTRFTQKHPFIAFSFTLLSLIFFISFFIIVITSFFSE
jgi:hypothetical protein